MKNLFKKGLNTVLYTDACRDKIGEFVRIWSSKDNVNIVHHNGEKFVISSSSEEIKPHERTSISILAHKLKRLPVGDKPGHYNHRPEVMKLIDASDATFLYDSEKDEFLVMKYRGVPDITNVRVKLDQLI